MEKNEKILFVLASLLLTGISPTSFAFDCTARYCVCPGGAQIQYGQNCPPTTTAPEHKYIPRKNWSSYSNTVPRDIPEIIKDARSQGYDFTTAGNIYEIPMLGGLLSSKSGRQKKADEAGNAGLIWSGYTRKALQLQAEYTAALARNNAQNKPSGTQTNEWVWVEVAYNDSAKVFAEKNTLTYNEKTKIASVLIKTAPFSCSAGSSDKSCYIVVDYQFQCDKKQEAGKRVRTYDTKTNRLISDDHISDFKYTAITKGSLIDHAMTTVCRAGEAKK